MSVFYPDPKPVAHSPSPEEKKAQDMNLLLLALMGGFFAAVWYLEKHAAELQQKYLEYFLMAAYVAVAGVCAVALFFLTKWTAKQARRVNRIRFLWNPSSGILAGRTIVGRSPLYLPDEARTGHVQIIGATGRGKTESVILPWIVRDLHRRRRNPILIDGKGDPKLVEQIRAATAHLPGTLQVFDLGNPERSWTTNPLANGTPQQIVDRIFTAFPFKDEYYKAVQYDVAGAAIALIQEVDGTDGKPGIVTFRRLYQILTDNQMLQEAIGRSKDPSIGKRLMVMYGSHTPKDRAELLKGLISHIGPFAVGEVAKLVNGPDPERPNKYFSVSDALLSGFEKRTLSVFLIPTLKYQQLGHQLGKLILQELGWAVGERASRYGDEVPLTPVFLDEFSAFAYEGFENILNKARSSRVALHLSHQAIGDFTKVSDAFAEMIHTNTNVKCLLGLNDPGTAEFFARHIGTVTADKLTEREENRNFFGVRRKTGDLSVRQVEEFIIHPNRLKNYTAGLGVLHLPGPNGNATEEVQFMRLEASDLKQREQGDKS
jgi:type IV secretory pathway TraG/TraD family ATPase VirD4